MFSSNVKHTKISLEMLPYAYGVSYSLVFNHTLVTSKNQTQHWQNLYFAEQIFLPSTILVSMNMLKLCILWRPFQIIFLCLVHCPHLITASSKSSIILFSVHIVVWSCHLPCQCAQKSAWSDVCVILAV